MQSPGTSSLQVLVSAGLSTVVPDQNPSLIKVLLRLRPKGQFLHLPLTSTSSKKQGLVWHRLQCHSSCITEWLTVAWQTLSVWANFTENLETYFWFHYWSSHIWDPWVRPVHHRFGSAYGWFGNSVPQPCWWYRGPKRRKSQLSSTLSSHPWIHHTSSVHHDSPVSHPWRDFNLTRSIGQSPLAHGPPHNIITKCHYFRTKE